jgi:anaerobic selenocysteine-containing dehydrogenase
MQLDRRNFLKGLSAAGLLSSVAGGALLTTAKAQAKEWQPPQTDTVKSTCVHCVNFCGIEVKKEDGVIRTIYPDTARAEFYNHGICPKGASGLFNTYNPYRIKKPVKRTNPKKGLDEDPKWVEISWEEAFDTLTQKLKKIRQENPAKLIWQHGHGKYLIGDKFPKAFAKAFGTPNLVHRTTTCEAARHVADEITWGNHGFLPDLEKCRLLLNFGANYFEAEQFSRWLDHASIDAQQAGMKVIAIEPRLSVCAAKADEWLPIRPGKDVVLLLGLARQLIELGAIDWDFLAKYTNAPILTDSKGYALKNESGEYLVWDSQSQTAKPYSEGVKPALTGTYQWQGESVTPSFDRFKGTLTDITPEYVEDIADIPAETVKRLAETIAEHAMIGATVMVEGKPTRYRPVAIHTFRGLSAKQFGTQSWRAGLLVQMLIGSIDSVGGILLHSPYKKPAYMEPSKAEYPPKRFDLQNSAYFPHATHNVAQQVSLSLLDPEAFGLDYQPEMQIFYATNRPFSASESRKQFEGMTKTFNVTIDIVMSETAWMSDIVLPDLTYLESWHYAPTRYTPRTKHTAIRQPMTNVYNIPHDGYSIIWQLAKRLGIRDDYIKHINKNWKLDKYKLETGKDTSAKEAVEKIWLESTKGKPFDTALSEGFVGKHLAEEKVYFNGIDKHFKGPGKPKIKFYADQLMDSMDKVTKQVESHQINNIDLDEYRLALSPLPLKEHAQPTPHIEAKDYPYYLITFKRMFRNQSGNTATNPILNSLGPDAQENGVVINKDTADQLLIKNGDQVVLETRIGKVQGKATVIQGIRPDTVAVSYHFGQQSPGLPEYARKGIWINSVLESHSDRISGMDSFNDTKCKIYKA